MELGRIKDQLNAVLDQMDKVEDKASQEYEFLLQRANDIRKIIQEEEKRRATEGLENAEKERELDLKERELDERKKDRWVKIGLGVGAGLLGFAGIYADETRVICKSGLDTVNSVTKIFR